MARYIKLNLTTQEGDAMMKAITAVLKHPEVCQMVLETGSNRRAADRGAKKIGWALQHIKEKTDDAK